jgi:hypothetical protein
MTSTTPWRRMILHFSHIGLTDGLTFMIPFRRLYSGGSALAAVAAAATGSWTCPEQAEDLAPWQD